MEIIDWLNLHNGFVMSVLTLVYVVATLLILVANHNSVKEMRRTREEDNRPYIIVFLESKKTGPINIVVKNIGKTIAKGTTINITPSLDHPESKPLSESNLLNKPIPDIPPLYEYKAFVGMGWDLKTSDGTYTVYTADVKYKGSNRKFFYNEEYILDLNFESGLLFLEEKDMNEFVKEFEKFKKGSTRALSSINTTLQKIASKDSQD